MHQTPDVQLRNVTKRFGSFTAVRSIDFDVAQGQFVTLLGPSGCGKTTTLRMIGGFETPDEGTILVGGHPLESGVKRTRMVFQSYALFPHMTVVQNVKFGLRMERVPRSDLERRTSEIIAMFGLSDHAQKFPRQLSGGQQQRVALARALVTKPRVLLLDEPLGALDLKMRKRMQGELKKLQREVGITFIYVTHDQEEALNLSDMIVVMDEGAIAQIGTPEEIYRSPSTSYVADFIGETNLWPGTVLSREGNMVRVMTALGEVTARGVPGTESTDGARVAVAIRPEAIVLGDAAVGAPSHRVGMLRHKSFLGAVTRAEVEVAGVTILADIRGTLQQSPGEAIQIGWRSDDAIVLAQDVRIDTEGRIA